MAKRQPPTQQAYSLQLSNQTNSVCNFVTYQQPPNIMAETLAWFVAPVAPGSIVTITWNTNYQNRGTETRSEFSCFVYEGV